MKATFINVGDGACAVYSDCGPYGPLLSQPCPTVMVVDCGSSGSLTGKDAALLLDRELGAGSSAPRTIVVSHFDEDHWGGLLCYAKDNAGKRFSGDHVDLIYPMVPKEAIGVSALVLAFITIEQGKTPSLSPLVLQTAWMATGAIVTSRALSAGQQFSGAGQTWDVLWPPAELPVDWKTAAATVLKRAAKLAGKIPLLDDAFRKAYGEMWRSREGDLARVVDEGDEWRDAGEQLEGPFLEHGGHAEAQADVLFDYADEEEERVESEDSSEAIGVVSELSDKIKAELQSVRNDLQEMNNGLSLVIAERNRSVVSFGDAEGWALRRIVQGGKLRPHYDLLVAPHHGTAKLGVFAARGFPEAWTVISQSGKERDKKFNPEYGARPRHARYSHRTFVDGNFTIWI